MNILMVTGEFAPYASTGDAGLAAAELAGRLVSRGHVVSVVLPFYRAAQETRGKKPKRTGAKFLVQVGNDRLGCEILETKTAQGVNVYFVERDEFFDRSGMYGKDGRDYQDNATRFIFFSKCAIEIARCMDPAPDVLHACNWQAALAPVFAADQGLTAKRVLQADSVEFQGNFWSTDFGLTNLSPGYFSARGLEYYGSLNFLKGGVLFSDAVILPGPRWVAESQTRARGSGLEPVMREHAAKLEGVMPGNLADRWNPATDATLVKKFRAPSGKGTQRTALLSEHSVEDGSVIVAQPLRAATARGVAATIEAADRLAPSGFRFVITGAVDETERALIEQARRRHAGRLVWIENADDATERRILAGADAMLATGPLMPDCELLVGALRFGTIPVVRGCGGLELIAPPVGYTGRELSGVSFPFYVDSADAVVDALRAMAGIYADSEAWIGLVARAMATDYSWDAAAESVEQIYSGLTGRPALAA